MSLEQILVELTKLRDEAFRNMTTSEDGSFRETHALQTYLDLSDAARSLEGRINHLAKINGSINENA